jgi:glucosyl-dolichyl phosphate glucuronosyltransferase
VPDVLLSVVVCTHDRPADLERCLGALARLEDRVEVIVVDSASQISCGEIVKRFASAFGALRYAYSSVPGLARARNAGLAAASSQIVAFVDDDAEPTPTWARTIVRPFAGDERIACVGGSCHPVFEARRPRWLSGRLLQFAGITRFGAAARESRSSAEYPFGANMAFRRADLLAAGGFPENLGRVGTTLLSGEEYEVIERLRGFGRVVWLEPDAVVDHHVAPERCRSTYYWRRLWWQGVSRARARRSLGVALRLACAAPIRLALWPLARDRVYLYRIAETAGYLTECLRARGVPA